MVVVWLFLTSRAQARQSWRQRWVQLHWSCLRWWLQHLQHPCGQLHADLQLPQVVMRVLVVVVVLLLSPASVIAQAVMLEGVLMVVLVLTYACIFI